MVLARVVELQPALMRVSKLWNVFVIAVVLRANTVMDLKLQAKVSEAASSEVLNYNCGVLST